MKFSLLIFCLVSMVCNAQQVLRAIPEGRILIARAQGKNFLTRASENLPVIASVIRRHIQNDSIVRDFTLYQQQPSLQSIDGRVIDQPGNTQLTCKFGDSYAQTWYVYAYYALPSSLGINGDNQIEVLDKDSRILARVQAVAAGNNISIMANSTKIYTYNPATLSGNKTLKFSSNGTSISVSFANQAYTPVGKYDTNANINYPSTLLFSQYNDHGRGVPLAYMRRGISPE